MLYLNLRGYNRSTNLQLPGCQNNRPSIRCNPTLSISISKWSSARVNRVYMYICIYQRIQQPFVTNQMHDLCYAKIPYFLFNRLYPTPPPLSIPSLKSLWNGGTVHWLFYSTFRVGSITIRNVPVRYDSIYECNWISYRITAVLKKYWWSYVYNMFNNSITI